MLSVFLDEGGELRWGWRLLAYVAAFGFLLSATALLISALAPLPAPADYRSEIGPGPLALNALLLFVPAAGALLLLARFVDGIPISAFGTAVHEGWGRDLGWGFAAAGAILLALHLAAGVLGVLRLEAAPHPEGFWPALLLILAALTVSAASEELVFRGYPLQVLMAGIGPWPAMILLSALFGLVHHTNPEATWVGTVNTFLAGLLLSVAYLRTRSLWFPTGLHIGWNVGLGPVMGHPVSGLPIRSIWATEMSGPEWLGGGAYGPEAGVLGTLLFLAAVGWVLRTRRVRVSPTVRGLLRAHPTRLYAGDVEETGRPASEPHAPG